MSFLSLLFRDKPRLQPTHENIRLEQTRTPTEILWEKEGLRTSVDNAVMEKWR